MQAPHHSVFYSLDALPATHYTQPFYGSLNFVRDNPGEPVPAAH